jgi:hypothetical protein
VRRLICLLGAIFIAWLSGHDAALAYWRSTVSPELASEIPVAIPTYWSGDPVLRLRTMESQQTNPETIAGQGQAVTSAAREILTRTPLEVLAMRQLALISSLKSTDAARVPLAYAERITRRDLPTELMSLQLASISNDTAGTIQHYHHALAVWPGTYERLLPGLASMMADQQVRRMVSQYIGQPWLTALVAEPVSYDAPPAAVMDFYGEYAGRLPIRDVQKGAAGLVRWLFSNQQYAFLSEYSDRIPGVKPSDMRAIGINAATVDPLFAPLSWTLINDASVESQVDGDGFTVSVEPGLSALIASRLTLLPPGQYAFSQRLEFTADAPRPELEWRVSCPQMPLEQLLVMQPAVPDAQSSATQQGRLTIPAGCAAQTWQLRGSAEDGQVTASLRVHELNLVRQ